MNRWAQMLTDLPPTLQRLIARRQRISLPRQCLPAERERRLRRALCRPAAVRAVYATLDPAAQQAVQALRDVRGGLTLAQLTQQYGPLRPLSAIAADLIPRSISEQLLLLGWLLPRPAAPFHPPRYLLPPELRQWLPVPLRRKQGIENRDQVRAAPVDDPAPAPQTQVVSTPADRAAVAILLTAMRQPLPSCADGQPRRATLRDLAAQLAPLPAAEATALARFVWSLLVDAGLLTTHAGQTHATPGATSFLALPPGERQARMRQGWLNAIAPDRWALALIPDRRGIDWPLLRRRLLAWGEAVGERGPAEAIAQFTALVAAAGPLADAQTHGFRRISRTPWNPRRTLAVWDAAVRGPLTWLGVVTGTADDGRWTVDGGDDEPPTAGRAGAERVLFSDSTALIRDEGEYALPSPLVGAELKVRDAGSAAQQHAPAETSAESAAWHYGSPGQLRVNHGAADADLLRLAVFGAWESVATGLIFTFTAASLARGLAQGHSPALLRDLLLRRAGPLPAGWDTDLTFDPPQVQIAACLLVSTSDPTVLREATAARSVRRYLGERLAPGLALVEPAQVAGLTAALERQGIAVDVQRGDTPPIASDLHPGERAALLVACAFYRAHAPADAPLLPHHDLEQRLRAALPTPLCAAVEQALAALDAPLTLQARSIPWEPAPSAERPIPWEPRHAPADGAERTAEPVPAAPTPFPAAGTGAGSAPILSSAGGGTTPTLTLLRRAIAEERALHLHYRDAKGEATERIIRPIALRRHGDIWYLEAHCLRETAERTFRVDRIVAIGPCATKTAPAPDSYSQLPPPQHSIAAD